MHVLRKTLRLPFGLALFVTTTFGLLTSLSSTAVAQTPGLLQDIKIAGAVDLVHPLSLEEQQTKINRLGVRSAEFTLFGAIDETFDGVLNFAGHSPLGFPHEHQPGNGDVHQEGFTFEIHEAYVGSSKLIPRSRFKTGKFLLGVGRVNQFHQHDWPFITAPRVQREFFNTKESTTVDAESASDTGFEFSTLLPLPFYLDLTLGVTNGYCWGHCHGEELRPATPVHYVRPATFISFGESGSGLLFALNYLGHKEGTGLKRTLIGMDATYKSREGKNLKWLIQSEIWNQNIEESNDPEIENGSRLGAYIYPQYGFTEKLQFGFRADVMTHDDELDWGFAPTLTYKTSEFSTLRLAYSHENLQGHSGEPDESDRRIDLQLIYMLGAHPAHDF